MKNLALASIVISLGLAAGCGPSNYAFRFDIADPGAHNTQRVGDRDTIEDADVRAEILADPTSFQAILLDLVNKTDQIIQVDWNRVVVIGPDGNETPLRPDSYAPTVEPGARLVTRLVTFVLPTRGSAASQYDNAVFELVVPMIVRGQSREYRYHLQAHAQSL